MTKTPEQIVNELRSDCNVLTVPWGLQKLLLAAASLGIAEGEQRERKRIADIIRIIPDKQFHNLADNIEKGAFSKEATETK